MTRNTDLSLVHLYCVKCRECASERGADFNCFFDGCEFECCCCGVCTNPEKCSATGKGYVWHV